MRVLAPLLAVLAVVQHGSAAAQDIPAASHALPAKVTPPTGIAFPAAVPNDNRTPAGTMHGGVLHVSGGAVDRLDAAVRGRARPADARLRRRRWQADDSGPVLRVRKGTRVRVSVRNPLPGLTLVVRGLSSHATDARDSLLVPSGATVETEFTADTEGTFFYWGTISSATTPQFRYGYDGQLNGAFVVDPPAPAPVRADRIFVIALWSDSSNADGTFSICPRVLGHQRQVVAADRAAHIHRGGFHPLADHQCIRRHAPHAPARLLFSRRRPWRRRA